MILRTLMLSLVVVLATAHPSVAAKRTMHLFTETYALDFSRSYVFVKRMNPPGSKRDTLLFQDDNKTIAVSASPYVAENTGKLMTREAYMAKMQAEKATDVKYVNDETPDGRLGSHLLGGCSDKNCFYKMQTVIDERIWLSIVLTCDQCSTADTKKVGKLVDDLYMQVKEK